MFWVIFYCVECDTEKNAAHPKVKKNKNQMLKWKQAHTTGKVKCIITIGFNFKT